MSADDDYVMFPAFQNASTGIRVVFRFSQTYYKLEKTTDGGETWINLDNGNYCYTIFDSDYVGWAMDWTTSNFYKYVGPPMPIPVELNSFTASVSGNEVNLRWSTATETNNKGFNVERKIRPINITDP